MPSVLWRCWLGGRKGIRSVKTEWWGAVLSKVQTCIWPSWSHCHSLSLASVKSRLVLPFWYWLTWVVLEKGPCVCVCVCVVCCVVLCCVVLCCVVCVCVLCCRLDSAGNWSLDNVSSINHSSSYCVHKWHQSPDFKLLVFVGCCVDNNLLYSCLVNVVSV